MIWVKICGTTNLEDARVSIDAGADALGFVFSASPRRVSTEQARAIVAKLPEVVDKVGVFVNEREENVLDAVRHAGLTAVQLHGDEPAEFARRLKAERPGIRVFKAVSFESLGQGTACLPLAMAGQADAFDALLVDGAPAGRGGMGRGFDWEQARTLLRTRPDIKVVVAGGLTSENVAEPIRALRPWGVDVVSGVECGPGKKDGEKVRAFVQAVRACENRL
jgi:phosphoribosylanthranilate isomerase